MKYAIFLLAVFLIAPGCSKREKSSLKEKSRAEESISKTIARMDKINDTLSVYTKEFVSAAREELSDPKFQEDLISKLDGYSRQLSSCKCEIKSLALVDKACRAKISKLQDVISKGEEKIILLQKEIADVKADMEKKGSQLARAL
ncbi:MAG TPA: hypothetical protein VHO43_15550 [Ignavibacteriales bacterium]|nr:hypothetical protein [Ignavibacteriales bacterium]